MAFLPLLGAGLSGAGFLGSLLGGGRERAPSAQQLNQQFGPEQLAQNQQQLFRMLASSPAFRNILQQQAQQGQQLGQNITAGLARRGLTTSGIGTIGSALGGAAGGFAQSQARAGLSSSALNASQQNLMAQLQAFTQLRGQEVGQPTPFGQAFGSLLGATPNLFFGGGGGGGGTGNRNQFFTGGGLQGGFQ